MNASDHVNRKPPRTRGRVKADEARIPEKDQSSPRKRRTPVIIVAGDFVSGVVSWALELRDVLRGHPRYDVQVLNFHQTSRELFDINVGTIEEAYDQIRAMAPVILVPNYVWDLVGLAINPRIRCLGFCHSDTAEEYYDPLEWYEPLFTAFVAVSGKCHRELGARMPSRSEDISTLPYGVTIPKSLRRTYEVAPMRLLYAGRVVQHQKRVMDLVPLVQKLQERKVDFVLDIVGWGLDLEDLQAAMQSVAQPGRVHFLGRVPKEQMSAIYAEHDVSLLTSEFEGTSVTMLEAIAHGTVPVITAVESGADQVIRHGENGYLVPIGDIEAMAFHLAYLASRPDQLRKLGRAARQASKGYSIETYSKRFVELLDGLPPYKEVDWPYWRFRAAEPPQQAPIVAVSPSPPPFLPATVDPHDEQRLIDGLSGEVLADRISVKKMFLALCFKAAKKPGLRWLRVFHPLGRRLLRPGTDSSSAG